MNTEIANEYESRQRDLNYTQELVRKNRIIQTIKSGHIYEKEILDNNFHLNHGHMTGNTRIFTHTECNKNFKIPKQIHTVMKSLSKYDPHLFLINLVPINGIFDLAESFVSFYKTITNNETHCEVHFLDSLRFMASSLDRLSGNLAKC